MSQSNPTASLNQILFSIGQITQQLAMQQEYIQFLTERHNAQMDVPNFSSPDKLVTICVGAEKKPFIIHKEAAICSPVLRAAFSSDFLEGQTQTYHLEEADSESFTLVVQWLYSRTFRCCLTPAEIESIPGELSNRVHTEAHSPLLDKVNNTFMHLIRVWNIADYLQLPRLQNRAVDAVNDIATHTGIMPALTLKTLYGELPRGAGIRELVFEQCRRYLDPKHFVMEQDVLPIEFRMDCARLEWEDRFNFGRVDPLGDRAEFVRRFHVPVRGYGEH